MVDDTVPAHRSVDSRSLPPEYVERIRARANAAGAAKSGLKSDQLGCVAILGIGGLIAIVAGISRLSSSGVDWVAIALPAIGVLVILGAVMMVMARRSSPIPEFTLSTQAYHLVSSGDGSLDVHCMPLCTKVGYTTVLLNGLYTQTELKAHFGTAAVVLTDVLDRESRDRPWEGSARFRAFLSMIESAAQALQRGRWSEVDGSNLLPGTPSPSAPMDAAALRSAPGSRTS
jgi:hypothetical protein